MSDAQDSLSVRRTVGAFDLSDATAILSLSGKDRVRFLQALTSNDVASLKPGFGQRNAILDKKSRILSDFYVYALKDSLLLLTDPSQMEALSGILEEMLFAEDVSIENETADTSVFALQGANASTLLNDICETSINVQEGGIVTDSLPGSFSAVIGRSYVGYPSYLILCPAASSSQARKCLSDAGVSFFNSGTLEILRIESGIPAAGKDFDDSIMLLELNQRDTMLSLDKGCYPGQEVVARTVSRGSPRRLLMGLVIDADVSIPQNTAVLLDGREAGLTGSATFSPSLQKTCVMAYLNKALQLLEDPTLLSFGDTDYEATVSRLPFYYPQDLAERAHAHYRNGMDAYHKRDHELAQKEFEAAIGMAPYYADAYEALAVMLERQDRHDEAIRINKQFAAIEPNAVMAHANLSRLYMLKGWIEKAEHEQAQAAAIGLRKAAQQSGESSTGFDERQKEDRARRIAIFKEVLAMDPEDEVANFGLGKLRCDDEEYEDAIRHLELVVSRNATYSAAYPLLARALRESGQPDQAQDVLTKGMHAARENGDMMPLRQMEELQQSLKN